MILCCITYPHVRKPRRLLWIVDRLYAIKIFLSLNPFPCHQCISMQNQFWFSKYVFTSGINLLQSCFTFIKAQFLNTYNKSPTFSSLRCIKVSRLVAVTRVTIKGCSHCHGCSLQQSIHFDIVIHEDTVWAGRIMVRVQSRI